MIPMSRQQVHHPVVSMRDPTPEQQMHQSYNQMPKSVHLMHTCLLLVLATMIVMTERDVIAVSATNAVIVMMTVILVSAADTASAS